MIGSGQQRSAAESLLYTAGPAVFIVADSATAEADARLSVYSAGGRVAQAVRIDEVEEALEVGGPADLIYMEIDPTTETLTDELLARLATAAEEDSVPILASVPLPLLDQTIARFGHRAELMCNPNLADRIATLGFSLSERKMRFHDVTTDVDPARLRKIADEVTRIAQALARITPEAAPALTRDIGTVQGFNDMMIGFAAEPVLTPFEQDAPLASDIRTMIRLRRLREHHFEAELFADPAWDMLLDLMAARLERKDVAVSSLCIAASVPPTTALRWIKTMTDTGILERCADPDDGRRIFIRLSDKAADGMSTYLSAAKKIGGLAI